LPPPTSPRDAADLLDELFHPPERAPNVRSGEREPISFIVRQLVYRRDHWTCQACGATPYARTLDRRSGALHLDHIVPWSAGGSDRSDNLRTLCGPCNYDRSNYVTGHEAPVLPIVGICTPCLTMPDFQPESSFPVYCGSRSHESWAIPGWQIL
jgi:hypothetical protein